MTKLGWALCLFLTVGNLFLYDAGKTGDRSERVPHIVRARRHEQALRFQGALQLVGALGQDVLRLTACHQTVC